MPFLAIDSTAITAIIFAAAVVVVVIAVAIADIVGIATLAFTVLGDGSCCRDGSFGGLLGIQAFATGLLVAVRVLVFIARFTAAVSAIISATTVLVLIITLFISFPLGVCALARASGEGLNMKTFGSVLFHCARLHCRTRAENS